MTTRKRQRFRRPVSVEELRGIVKKYRVGDQYDGSIIKSIRVLDGIQCPTKAHYDDDTLIESSDKRIGRVVLANGMIHYLRQNTYQA